MIGRAYLWGLAANGQAGVENVLDIMRNGVDSALLALGRSSIGELSREDVIIPAGFLRVLGGLSGPGPVRSAHDGADHLITRASRAARGHDEAPPAR
jgi:hypothetical protein